MEEKIGRNTRYGATYTTYEEEDNSLFDEEKKVKSMKAEGEEESI